MSDLVVLTALFLTSPHVLPLLPDTCVGCSSETEVAVLVLLCSGTLQINA